ncbi:MAG TPA: hypothetical protein VMW03_07060 [Candidatus Krumholzibacteriaceae bacterium]|nr:hypothetical protein [Candidatus Krumholzibacteriaceae bacterium]
MAHRGGLAIDPLPFLLESDDPIVRYNVAKHLLKAGETELAASRNALNADARVASMIEECTRWPDAPLKRHNDAGHPLHKIELLADFGLTRDDAGICEIIERVTANQTEDGRYLSPLAVPERWGGYDAPHMDWMNCDNPVLLYSLIRFGAEDPGIKEAVETLVSSVHENGWRCGSSLRFRGPGRKSDFCPYANLVTLKAFAADGGHLDSDECAAGVEAQLWHWENRAGRKIMMFGIGTTFMRLKLPHVWYDVLHVLEVMSHFPAAVDDPRFTEMMELVNGKQRGDGSFVPESVYTAWRGWSFGQKREPCPLTTLRVAVINRRIEA